MASDFVRAWRVRQREAHAIARELGWHDNPVEDGTRIALMHAELSEALEFLRKPAQDDHIPDFTGVEAELADVVIRILDFAGLYDLRVGEAIEAKMLYNRTRPRKHGGKAF